MSQLNEFISKIRAEYFSDSSQIFYNTLTNSNINMTFVDFQSIEHGNTQPSKEVINCILKNIDQADKEKLIQYYCDTLFPEHSVNVSDQKIKFSKQKAKLELNEYQVKELAKTKIHYYLFLVLLLKSEKIKKHILKKQFGNNDSIEIAIQDLIQKGILIENNNYVYSMSPDVQFPANNSEEIKKLYIQFDEWDRGFSKAFQYDSLIEKTLIRKVNPKHIPIIQKQLEAILDTIRTSETPIPLNENEPVVFLQLNFARSK